MLTAEALRLSEAYILPGFVQGMVPTDVLLAPLEGLLPAVTLMVVVTLLDTPFAWPPAVAVTEVLVVPVVLPDIAVTGRGTVVFAPGARTTVPRLAATVKSVLLELVTGRLKVVLVHAAVSLLVMLSV